MNARENRNVFSLDLNVLSESLSVTVLGRDKFTIHGRPIASANLSRLSKYLSPLLLCLSINPSFRSKLICLLFA